MVLSISRSSHFYLFNIPYLYVISCDSYLSFSISKAEESSVWFYPICLINLVDTRLDAAAWMKVPAFL